MNWYLVRSKPHQESVAVMRLNQLGIETFCPYRKKVKRGKDTYKTDGSPLFPGYLFSKFNGDTQHRLVTYAQGVGKVVTFGEHPAIVDKEIVESITARMQNGLVVLETQSFKSGDRVLIHEGPFEGFQAIFEKELAGTERVALLFQAVSYQARVLIDRNFVENIGVGHTLG